MGYEASAAGETIIGLCTSESQGLSAHEAAARQKKFGRNELAMRTRRTARAILASQFESPLVFILVAASLIAGYLGDAVESGVIVSILVVNAGLGFVQEYRGEQALEKLAKFVVFRSTVMRDGALQSVDARDLVPGDIVHLEAGDNVPADLRVLESHELAVNQSVLTGESEPAEKSVTALLAPASSLQEMRSMAFMGTTVASGAGSGVVVATGRQTELGKTAASLEEKAPQTDFERNIGMFGEMLVAVIFLMTVFVLGVNLWFGRDPLGSLLFALAIAVGITPEMLPMIITISLSSGALTLAHKKVVVKRLDAIEDLGNVDVLCTDKTGTLTENAISLQGFEDAAGGASEGILTYALLASPVSHRHTHFAGTPIDTALWEHAKGGKSAAEAALWKRVDEVPFDHERRMVSAVCEKQGELVFVTKGSPESVLSRCSAVLLSDGRHEAMRRHARALKARYAKLSAGGMRVIAVAAKRPRRKADYAAADESDLTFLGFVSFSDPPRKSAREALRTLRALGVEVKLLTGDEPHVAAAICKAVGLELKGGRVILGADLPGDEAKLGRLAESCNVFARLTPSQKTALVSALKQNGHVVGFIGDGVNDAPALHAADAGISVDTGADVAKESADVILLHHGLHVVADGIMEGRKTFANTMKYILNTISANFGNMFTVAISSTFLSFIPLLPSQILLNNFVSDIPLMTVSTDRVDKEDLGAPRRWSIPNIAKFMIFFGLVSTVFDLMTMGLLIAFLRVHYGMFGAAQETIFRTGWFLESTLSEIIVTFAIRTKKPFFASPPSNLLLGSSLVVALGAVAAIYVPDFARLFEFQPLGLDYLAIIACVLATYFVIAEFAKRAFFRYFKL